MDDIEQIEQAMVTIRRRATRRSLTPPNLPFGSSVFDVLDAVEAGEDAGSPVGVSAVAEALHIDQPRASRLVAAVIGAGLVRREADQHDGRRALLVRTDAGRRLSVQVHRGRRAAFAAAMSDWSKQDRTTFAQLLTRFVVALGASTPSS